MHFPKLDFRRRRRATPSSDKALPPPPTVASGNALYSTKSVSVLSFATTKSAPVTIDNASRDSGPGANNKSGGRGAFIKKLARKIASKHDLKQAFRAQERQPRLSFDDSDDSDYGDELDEHDDRLPTRPAPPPPTTDCLRPCLKQPTSQSPTFTTTHPASRRPGSFLLNNEVSQFEILRSVGPFCTDEEERMWKKYRSDRARRASTAGLPMRWRADGGVEIQTLCLDATEEGRQVLGRAGIVDEIPLLPKSVRTDDAGYKVTLLGSHSDRFERPASFVASPMMLEKAARRAVSCDALSRAYNAHASTQVASVRNHRLVQARGTSDATEPPTKASRVGEALPSPATVATRRVSTRPAAPSFGPASEARDALASPTKPDPGRTPRADAQLPPPTSSVHAVSPASPSKAPLPVERSFQGYPDSIIHGYECTFDSVDLRDLPAAPSGRAAVHSVVSDSFAYDSKRSSSGTSGEEANFVDSDGDNDVDSVRTTSFASTPTSCEFDSSAHGDEAQVQIDEGADDRDADGKDSSTTPHMSFIDLAPFPSPLSIHRLSFCDDSFATSTPQRPFLRKTASPSDVPHKSGSPDLFAGRDRHEDASSVADEPDNTSPSMCSEASFSDAYFAVATRATTTVPRVLQNAVGMPLPTSPTDGSGGPLPPASPPANMSSIGRLEWRKLSHELGLTSPVLNSERTALTPQGHASGGAHSPLRAGQIAVGHDTPTPSEISLELFRAKLRAALSPVGRSFDTVGTPDQTDSSMCESSTSAAVGRATVPSSGRSAADAGVRRRMTPRYRPTHPASLASDAHDDVPFTPPRAPLHLSRVTAVDSAAGRVAKRPPTLDLADLSSSGQEAMKQAWLSKVNLAMLAVGRE